MLKFTGKVVGNITHSVDVTEKDIENIIVTSFEGGSYYWMGVDNTTEEWKDKPKGEPVSTWATKLIIEGKEVKLYDVEGSDDDSEWILTLDKILDGIKLNKLQRSYDADLENMDAITADSIIQYALFKEIVYN
jgi:hypothetical protein